MRVFAFIPNRCVALGKKVEQCTNRGQQASAGRINGMVVFPPRLLLR